jgi:hypothetical protein
VVEVVVICCEVVLDVEVVGIEVVLAELEVLEVV